MSVFFPTGLGESLVWQKSSGTGESDFKIRKFQLVQYKVATLKKALILIGLVIDEISLNFLLLFVNFGHGIHCLKSIFLSEAPVSCYEKL